MLESNIKKEYNINKIHITKLYPTNQKNKKKH